LPWKEFKEARRATIAIATAAEYGQYPHGKYHIGPSGTELPHKSTFGSFLVLTKNDKRCLASLITCVPTWCVLDFDLQPATALVGQRVYNFCIPWHISIPGSVVDILALSV